MGPNFDYKYLRIMAEESSKNGKPQPDLTNDITWIIDPLDGTMNFVHGYPMIAISVALFMNKKPLIGIIFNPIGKQLFTAKTGQGAFLNGKRIFSSANKGYLLYEIWIEFLLKNNKNIIIIHFLNRLNKVFDRNRSYDFSGCPPNSAFCDEEKSRQTCRCCAQVK